MTNWRSLVEKDYLASYDLVDRDGQPKDFTLEISDVKSVSLKTREQPRGKRKCVITFKGATKRFVSNTTNSETIESMYGPDYERWIGQRVTLYKADVRSPKGGTIPGIRIRPKKPTAKAESIVSQPIDEASVAARDAAFDREPGDDSEEDPR